MKRKLLAVLCMALIACMALPLGLGALAEANSTLYVDQPALTLKVGQTKTVKLTWTGTSGQLYYAWDNAAVIKFEKSPDWVGQTKELYITGLAAGTAIVTITCSSSSDVATIKVTVQGEEEERQQDVRELLGMSVKNANKRLEHKLKKIGGAYANGYFSAKLNAFKRISDITVTSGNGRYSLFSIYPGMRFTQAASHLKKLGWKKVKRTGGSYFYLNDTYPCHAVCLEKKSSKVSTVRYYVP